MFAATMTLSPFFCLIANLFEIKIKINAMCHYSRRGIAQGASGIGAWQDIMMMISFFCIPVNVAIVFYAGDGDYNSPGKSSLRYYLEDQDSESWNLVNIVLLLVLIEHLLVAFKLALKEFIPDVDASVLEAEKKRVFIQKKARDTIGKLKTDSCKCYEDVLESELYNEAEIAK